ncbi:hypothetical protein CKAN_02377000 [Cinnamomum micranthum f. kanehirae]|uniref:Uncharacterized protein n=1 Tax=Cinnamomum micranthum f. kanehirae TaxID=337451 RepID=A0A443PUL6_9MAGN|nr:hypothetical protein CKAN_02377000 [Cinnamomum micranthum f. kanehirae]
MFRSEMVLWDNSYMEKRQLFLRSYNLSRKKSAMERLKLSLIRVRRVVWLKLRRLRRFIWSRFKHGYNYGGRRRSRLHPFINMNMNTKMDCLFDK